MVAFSILWVQRCLEFYCEACNALPGEYCRTESGNVIAPHQARVFLAELNGRIPPKDYELDEEWEPELEPDEDTVIAYCERYGHEPYAERDGYARCYCGMFKFEEAS